MLVIVIWNTKEVSLQDLLHDLHIFLQQCDLANLSLFLAVGIGSTILIDKEMVT